MATIMGIITFYKPRVENQAPVYCHCQNSVNGSGSKAKAVSAEDRLRITEACSCGEAECKTLNWTWDSTMAHPETRISEENIIFHPIYSQGTSVVRGTEALEPKCIHYWEIKIVTCMSGTDLMIGIGTGDLNLTSHQYRFASFLGLTDQSWGYSFRGLVQHANALKYYGKKFGQGCIVGVHLDLFKGILEFYLNRKPQGIAYRFIPRTKKVIYPMTCSTSAKSAVKLINASSIRESLQYHCMKVICKYPKLVKIVKQMPGLRQLSDDLWYLQCKEKYQYKDEFEKNNLLLEDEAILSDLKKKKLRLELSKKTCDATATSDQSDCDSPIDIYENVNKIKHVSSTEATTTDDDDDEALTEENFFCNH